MRKFLFAPIAALALALGMLAGGIASPVHAQTYGPTAMPFNYNVAGALVLPVDVGYGQTVQLALSNGQVVDFTCMYSFCPAGLTVDPSMLVLSYSYSTPYVSSYVAPSYGYNIGIGGYGGGYISPLFNYNTGVTPIVVINRSGFGNRGDHGNGGGGDNHHCHDSGSGSGSGSHSC